MRRLRVPQDVVVGFVRGNLVAAGADHRDQLGFPVEAGRHRRVVDRTALGNEVVRRLCKEERLLAAVAPISF